MPDPSADPVAELVAARRAALNVMEDALLARDALRASEARLTRELEATKLLQRLSSLLIGDEAGEGLEGAILDAAVAIMRSDFGSIQMFDADRGELRLLAWRNFHPDSAAYWRVVSGETGTACGTVLRHGRRVLVRDVNDPATTFGPETLRQFRLSGIVAVQSTPLTTRDGRLIGMISTHWREPHSPDERELRLFDILARQAADFFERRRAVADLRRTEDRLRLALAAARMGTWTLDADAGTQVRDAYLNRLLGLDPGETAQPFAEFFDHVHPADRARVQEAFDASLRDARPLTVEFRVVRPDGSERWLRDQGDVFGDAAAGRRVMAGACVDVTERVEAEAAVRASEERLKQIVDSATDYAILTLDDDRVVTGWSPGAAAAFGFTADEIVGRSADVLFTPEDRAAGAPAQETGTARRDGRAADERWHLRKDGTRFYASGVLTPLAAGGFVKVARDLTERKRMEDELRAARDLLEQRVAERTAELSGAIEALEAEMGRRRETALRLATAQEDERKRVSRDLHDTVGQTHAALTMALRAAAAAVPAGGEAAERLAYAAGLAEAMGRELHEAAVRLRPAALDDIGLGPAVAELVAQWAARTGVTAEHNFTGLEDGRLPAGVETALYRVVQEALTNVARHAGATTVSVTVARSEGEARAVVEDDGAGFSPEAGTIRLGLAGMRERVELVGGTLEVESAPGRGTTVIARVPVPDPPRA